MLSPPFKVDVERFPRPPRAGCLLDRWARDGTKRTQRADFVSSPSASLQGLHPLASSARGGLADYSDSHRNFILLPSFGRRYIIEIWKCLFTTGTEKNGEEAMESCNRLVKLGRRQFLRGGATTAAATVAAGIIPQRADATPALARITYPSTKLVNVKDLKVDAPADPIPRQGF